MAKKQSPKNAAPQIEPEKDFKVVLKPFLGMKPGLYLTILYALLAVILVYLLLFLPGIRKNGSFLLIDSAPAGAAVWIDDEYAGAAPLKVFVPKGLRTVRLSKPFFANAEKNITVNGRIFASRIVPRRQKVFFPLTLNDRGGLFAESFLQTNEWALVGRVFYNYQIPQNLKTAAIDASSKDGVYNFNADLDGKRWLEALPLAVSNEYLLKDYVEAGARIVAEGGALSPFHAVSLVREIALFLQNEEASAYWLNQVLPDGLKKDLADSNWYAKKIEAYRDSLKTTVSEITSGKKAAVSVNGVTFGHVPGGRFIAGMDKQSISGNTLENEKNIPYHAAVDDFYIMNSEVSWKEFESFLNENPSWLPSNAEALTVENKATETYLQRDEAYSLNPSAPADAAYNVSFWAAKAFCEWLTAKLPDALAGYEVRLPHEEEWEWAAETLGTANFTGGLWEWCGNWYFPMATFFPDTARHTAADSRYRGAEIAVRGGSWANQPGSISSKTRASQPPQWCTPFLGFRAVIAPKR